jgi:hypothetical protein
MAVQTVTVWRLKGNGQVSKSHDIIGSRIRVSIGQDGTGEKPEPRPAKPLRHFLVRDPEPMASSVHHCHHSRACRVPSLCRQQSV